MAMFSDINWDLQKFCSLIICYHTWSLSIRLRGLDCVWGAFCFCDFALLFARQHTLLYTKVCHSLSPTHSIAALCSSALSFHCQSVQTHSHHTSEHTLNNTNTHTRAKKNLRVYIFWFANEKRMKTSKIFAVCRRVCSFFIWTTIYHIRNNILEPTHWTVFDVCDFDLIQIYFEF